MRAAASPTPPEPTIRTLTASAPLPGATGAEQLTTDDHEQCDEEHHRADDVDLHWRPALRRTPHVHGERHRVGARVEVRDDVVVEGEREGEQRTRSDGGGGER